MSDRVPETGKQIFTGKVDAYGMVGGFEDVTSDEAKSVTPKEVKGVKQDGNTLIQRKEDVEVGFTKLVGAKIDEKGMMHGGTWVKPDVKRDKAK